MMGRSPHGLQSASTACFQGLSGSISRWVSPPREDPGTWARRWGSGGTHSIPGSPRRLLRWEVKPGRQTGPGSRGPRLMAPPVWSCLNGVHDPWTRDPWGPGWVWRTPCRCVPGQASADVCQVNRLKSEATCLAQTWALTILACLLQPAPPRPHFLHWHLQQPAPRGSASAPLRVCIARLGALTAELTPVLTGHRANAGVREERVGQGQGCKSQDHPPGPSRAPVGVGQLDSQCRHLHFLESCSPGWGGSRAVPWPVLCPAIPMPAVGRPAARTLSGTAAGFFHRSSVP